MPPATARERLEVALTTLPPLDDYQSVAVEFRRGWVTAIEWLIERDFEGAAHSLLDATVGWADFSHPKIDETSRQIAENLVAIKLATRDMIYPLRTDALSIVRDTKRRVAHLNDIAR